MSLIDSLFRKRRLSMAQRRPGLLLERLEVRRALAADDGSDPWDGVAPDDGSGDDGSGAVDCWFDPNDPAWCDPGDVIAFSLPPTGEPGEGGEQGDGGAGGDRGGDPEVWVDPLPVCWLPLVDENGNPLPEPFWRTTTDPVAGAAPLVTSDGPHARPTDVVATLGADGIVVSWNDPFANSGEGGPAIDGYVVEARRLRDAEWSVVESVTGATTLTVSGLDGGAHHVFRVTKTNIGMTMMLSAPSRPSRPFTTPAGTTIAVEKTAVGGARISWDAATVGGGDQIVEFRRLAATEWVRAGAFPAGSGVATIDGLPGGRHYTFRILSAGGVYSPRTRAVTLPEQVDYLLRATSDADGTVFTWSDPLAATRTETVVEYRRLKDVAWLDLGSVASTAGATTIDGLVPNANYVFRLRQRDANGQWSRTVATRPVTVSPDCVFPPACVDYPAPAPSGTLLLVNPSQGQSGTVIAGAPAEDGTGEALMATGTLSGTGTLVGRDEQAQPEYFLSGTGDDPTA